MSKRRSKLWWLLPLALASLPGAGAGGVGAPAAQGAVQPFAMRVVASGFNAPWELTMGPDRRLWVTERLGKRVVRVDPATGQKRVALTLPYALAGGQHLGVLGMALHPDLLKGVGRDWVYVVYTYGTQENVKKRIARYTFDPGTGTLGNAQTVLDNLPGGTDHNAGRLKIGPDGKLYLTMGDLGHNQLRLYCEPITAQVLPTAAQIAARDWTNYTGKILRLNLDGSVPADNPVVGGVRSHLYTVGHRNPQGLAFGNGGILYSSEQGPNSDDEVNILRPGGNYGWPYIAGYRDDQAYAYANWSAAPNCSSLTWDATQIPPGVPTVREIEWNAPNRVDALMTFWTVPSSHDYTDTSAFGQRANLARPSASLSSIEVYEKTFTGIPGWQNSLLVPALKYGGLYRVPLLSEGLSTRGEVIKELATSNRYRDTAISPDTRTIYVITDNDEAGNLLTQGGQATNRAANPGALLAFTYTGR